MKSSKKLVKRIFQKLALLILSIILLLVAIKIYGQLDRALFIRARHQAELDELNKQYQSIRSERLKYEEAIEKLKDDYYIELIARKQLRMIKPGEKYYIVVFKDSEKENEKETKKNNSLLELLTTK